MKATKLARMALCGFAFALALVITQKAADAAPALPLPWLTGAQHRINGGNTYGCDTHNTQTASSATAYNADYYAIDFQFQLGDDVSAVAAGTNDSYFNPGYPLYHDGVDFNGVWDINGVRISLEDLGEPILAAQDGIVVLAADENDDYGIKVDVHHGGNVYTRYAHLQAGSRAERERDESARPNGPDTEPLPVSLAPYPG